MIHILFRNLRRQAALIVARALLQVGQVEAATSQIQKLLQTWPEDLALYDLLLTIYQDQRDWKSFFEAYELADRNLSNNLRVKLGLGTALLVASRPREALPYLEFCVQNWDLSDDYAEAFANVIARVGICHAYLGEWTSAQMHLNKAAEISPNDLDFAFGTVLVMLGTGHVDDIGLFLDSRIKEFPNTYALHYWRAYYTQYFQHRPTDSLKGYESALLRTEYIRQYRKYSPRNFSLMADAVPEVMLKEYAEALIKAGERDESVVMSHLGKLDLPRNMDSLILRTHVRILLGEAKRAEELCRAKLQKKLRAGDANEYWTYLAIAQMMAGEYEQGIRSAQEAISLDSGSSESLEVLGALEMKTGDWVKAEEAFVDLTEREPFNPSYWKNLGACNGGRREWEAAIAAYERALLLDPRDAQGWLELGSLYLQLEREDSARSAYERALALDTLEESQRKSTLALLGNL